MSMRGLKMEKQGQTIRRRFDSGRTSHDVRQQQEYATWFRNQFRWDWYLTLTFSGELSSQHASNLLHEYLREIEEKVHAPLSCLIAKEQKYSGLGKPSGRVHFISCSHATRTYKEFLRDHWQQPKYGGDRTSGPSADVRPYLSDISAT